MMAMMTMERRCIRTGQPPNSKVARTPTLPIPPMRCTPQCIPVHHSADRADLVFHAALTRSASPVLVGREEQSVELQWREDFIAAAFISFFLGSVWARRTCNKERKDTVTLIVDWQYWQPWIIALTGNADR